MAHETTATKSLTYDELETVSYSRPNRLCFRSRLHYTLHVSIRHSYDVKEVKVTETRIPQSVELFNVFTCFHLKIEGRSGCKSAVG